MSAAAALLALLAVGASYLQLALSFQDRLGGTPSVLLSSSLKLAPGTLMTAQEAAAELEARGYSESAGSPPAPGQYRRRGDELEADLRPFIDAEARQEGGSVRLVFGGGRLQQVLAMPEAVPLEAAWLEPLAVGVIHGHPDQLREPVTLAALPPFLAEAVLAVEDRRFRRHRGLDMRGMARALVADLRAGRVEQGGSTITQQVVKNVMLSQERRVIRKLREAVMAPLLETLLTKDQILEIYLNEIYLGQKGGLSVVGVGAAARFYFGRSVSELDVGQCALMAGLIRSPGYYNPWRDRDRARSRRDEVLGIMEQVGLLEAGEAEAARARPLRLADATGDPFPEAGSFLDAVRHQLAGQVGTERLERKGLRVLTTLDMRIQKAAAAALGEGLRRLEHERRQARQAGGLQGAVVVMSPRSGAVLALVGDRVPGSGRFNRAVDARRPIGSLMKPFVYLAAFEAADRGRAGGLTPASVLQDEPIAVDMEGNEAWEPENSDSRFRGPVTVRRALADSVNIPAVRAALGVGIEAVVEKAMDCGLPADMPRVPAVALGAAEASPLQVATAYSTLAAGGRRTAPRLWDALADPGGGIRDRQRPRHVKAADPAAAFLVSDLLVEALRTGTGRHADTGAAGGTLAGKTGTSNSRRDSWFAGYGPDLVAVVWVGADDNRSIGLTGSQAALPIWADLMRRIHAGRDSAFEVPRGVVQVAVDADNGALASRNCPRVLDEWFLDGTAPLEECGEHRRRGFWRRLFGRD